MHPERSPLPVARIEDRRWYLKDPEFMSEIGGALTFLGIMLWTLVVIQRAAEEGPAPDPSMSHVMAIMLLVLYSFTCSGCVMASMRLTARDGLRPRLVRVLVNLVMGFVAGNALTYAIVMGVLNLIIPLQVFIGWLTTTTGFTLLLVMRRRARSAADLKR